MYLITPTHPPAGMPALYNDWHLKRWGVGAMGVEAREFHQEHKYLYWGPILFSGWWRKKIKKKTRENLSKYSRNRKGSLKKNQHMYIHIHKTIFEEKIIRKRHTCQRQSGKKIWLKMPVAEIAGAPKEWDSPGIAGDKSWLVWLAAWGDIWASWA